jgi:hypothetical protein
MIATGLSRGTSRRIEPLITWRIPVRTLRTYTLYTVATNAVFYYFNSLRPRRGTFLSSPGVSRHVEVGRFATLG